MASFNDLLHEKRSYANVSSALIGRGALFVPPPRTKVGFSSRGVLLGKGLERGGGRPSPVSTYGHFHSIGSGGEGPDSFVLAGGFRGRLNIREIVAQ